jgi:hypothetical protein
MTHLHIVTEIPSPNAVFPTGYQNPLEGGVLTPAPIYDTEFPKVDTVNVVPDRGLGPSFQSLAHSFLTVVDRDADVLAQVEGRSWNFYPNKSVPPPDDAQIPTLPYKTVLNIQGPSGYAFSRTVQFDSLSGACYPGQGVDIEQSLGELLFAGSSGAQPGASAPLDTFQLVLTNVDPTASPAFMGNIVESNWPVGEKNPDGTWMVPNGNYSVAVTSSEYNEPSTQPKAIQVVVDHASRTQASDAQHGER